MINYLLCLGIIQVKEEKKRLVSTNIWMNKYRSSSILSLVAYGITLIDYCTKINIIWHVLSRHVPENTQVMAWSEANLCCFHVFGDQLHNCWIWESKGSILDNWKIWILSLLWHVMFNWFPDWIICNNINL